MKELEEFLDELNKRKIYFELSKIGDEGIMVDISIPGERWEIDFMKNGMIEIEKFISDGTTYDKSELNVLFKEKYEEDVIEEAKALLSDYLSGKTLAGDLIKQYNAFIAQEDFPWNSNSDKLDALDDFHDELSLFLDEPELKLDNSDHYGEKELKAKVKAFLEYLKIK